MHDAMVVERGELGGGSFCFVQIWLWVCTADAKGVKSRKTAARAKHTSLSAPCRPVTPAAHNLLPFNLVLHSSFPFKIVLRVVAIADSAVSDFKARQVDRGRRTQIVSAPSLPHTCLLIEHGFCTLSLSKLFPPIVYTATPQLNRRASFLTCFPIHFIKSSGEISWQG